MTIHAERDISYVLVQDGIQIGDGSGSCLSDLSRIEKLTIPDEYEDNNKKVVSIGQYAFGKNNAYQCIIGELILSKNLLTIDSYAFQKSTIDTIIFPDSLNEVKESAFHSAKLKNISFEYCNENIKEIPVGFFWGATVQSFHIPASVVKINWAAFCYTNKFDKITSDSPNFVVHNGILYSSDYRTLIKYPSNCYIDILPTVTEISDCGGFAGFSHANFVLKNKIRKFGFACFGFCYSMITCDLSCSLATKLTDSMFYYSNKLEKVIFPNTMNTFTHSTFEGCTSLKSIILPINLRSTKEDLGNNFILNDIYYCGANNLQINFAGNPNIHVTSDYPYDTFLSRQVTDRSYICEESHKSFFYDPREIICTQRQIYYSNYFSFFMIYAIILLEDGK